MTADNDVIPGIAFGFAGGLGNTGSVCGAVSGAAMAISLKSGRPASMEDALRVLGTVQEFRRRFEAEMETINCRELTGADLTTQEGLAKYMGSDTARSVCFQAVGTAYRLSVELLKDTA